MADDLHRWLRAVRPDTDADAGWADSDEGARVLVEIRRRTTSRRARPRGRRLWVQLPGVAVALVAVLVVADLGRGGPVKRPAGVPDAGPALPALRPAAKLLQPFDACPALLSALRAKTARAVTAYGLPQTSPSYGYGFGGEYARAAFPELQGDAAAGATSAGIGGGTSGTNDQEIGVDEPDVVKAADDQVVTITDGQLHVLDAANHAITGSLDLTIYDGWQDAQLLVAGDHAVVFLGASPSSLGRTFGGAFEGATSASGRSTVLFVDLSGTPVVTGSLRTTGAYVDARLVGSTVRLVVDSTPQIVFPQSTGDAADLAHARAIVDAAPLSAWLPSYTVTVGARSTTGTVPCSRVSHPASFSGTSLTSVYTLDLDRPGADPAPITVLADGDTVYATATSLYVSSTTGRTPVTEVHRFDVSGSAPPTYLGSGSIPGRPISSYSFSEYGGALRATTTDGSASGVYDLDAQTLALEGKVDDLDRGEELYAVRYVGPTAYVVTFRQVDPLLVLDLHDPASPKVVGKLIESGYSDYLHDAGGGRLIGVGAQLTDGEPTGLQVSLFDVRDTAAPTRTGQVVLPQTYGTGTLDPHAFLDWQPTGLVAVPTMSWAPGESGRVLVLRLSGTSLTKVGLLTNPSGTEQDDGLGIQRSLVVDGALWTVSGSGVLVSDQATLAREAWLPFS